MRNAYVRALYDIASKDNRIFILTADIGIFAFNRIKEDFPDRFYNLGVAEANMMSIAAGLALSGKIPFTFGIAPFVTMRCLEQIRIDICYQVLPVKIVSVGGGFVYGAQGTTHHAIEDLGILRTLPEIVIICPADPIETEKATYATMDLERPTYIRIGRNNEPSIYKKDYDFKIGKAVIMREGEDITLISCGLVVRNVLEASEELAKDNINARVVNMHTIKPIDHEMILRCAEETGAIVTVEEHNIIGGLGSAVAEVLAEEIGFGIPFRRIGIEDTFCRFHADYPVLQERYGVSKKNISKVAKELLS
ncbi:MAG: transketolase C-terminal domain-containing protein [bacterium]|nr:transketolase C-terminal domain-containing protein [bacterium]